LYFKLKDGNKVLLKITINKVTSKEKKILGVEIDLIDIPHACIPEYSLSCTRREYVSKTPTKTAIGTVTAIVEGRRKTSNFNTFIMPMRYSMTKSLKTKREFIMRKKVKIKKLNKKINAISSEIYLVIIFILLSHIWILNNYIIKG